MTTRSSIFACATALAVALSGYATASTSGTQAAATTTAAAEVPAAAATDTTPAQEASGNLSYSNKWRIEVSEGANSDGVILFQVTPKGGATQEVKVVVDNGTSENHVARVIERAFEAQLDGSKYDIETDDGEDVLVKRDFTEPVFALQLVSSTVQSVRLDVEKE